MLLAAAAVYFGILFFVWHLSSLFKDFGWFSILIIIGEFFLGGWLSEKLSDDKKDKDKDYSKDYSKSSSRSYSKNYGTDYAKIPTKIPVQIPTQTPTKSWMTQVTDLALEKDIEARSKHFDTNEAQQKEALEIYSTEIVPGATQIHKIVSYKDILMAKHGKLSQIKRSLGFTVTDPGYNYTHKDAMRIIQEQHTIVRWINKELIRHGVVEKLYFSTDHTRFFPADQATDTECGTYKWGPTVPGYAKYWDRSVAES